MRVALEGFLHQQASEFLPRRVSVWPVAIHIRRGGGCDLRRHVFFS